MRRLIFFKKRELFTLLRHLLMILYGLTTLAPFLWILLSSFKENNEIYLSPFALPESLLVSNYVTAWKTAHIGLYLLNSAFISTMAVLIVIVVASMASYILARVLPNQLLYSYFTLGIMIPTTTILIPTFILMRSLSLYNSQIGLIILYAVSNLSLAIFILVGFMKSIPKEMEEAAELEGCSLSRTFFQIIFPLCKPGIATIATLAFLNCWNEYLFAYVFISNSQLKTITQGIFALKGTYNTNYGLLSAGLVMEIIPVVIAYIFFQEQVVAGMTAGAVKG